MRVLIIGMHYSPELTGNAPYTAGLAEYLVGRGDLVTVIAGLPHYPDWRIARGTQRKLWAREMRNGVRVIRAAHYVPRRQSALSRAAYEATFALTGLVATLRVSRPDVIIGIVPTLGDAVLARLTAWRFRVPYGLLFQDLMGPAAGHSGVPGGGRVARMTTAAEGWAAGAASAVAVVTQAFIPYLERVGVAPALIHHIPNWSRAMTPELSPAETRRRFGWDDGRMIVLHAGNMGYKQGLEQVVDAARLAAQRQEPLRFVLAGGGNRETALREAATGLSNLEFLGVQPDGIHASLLAAADVLLLSERDDETDMSLPSKLTSYFAAGRPTVAAAPPTGATAAEVRRSGAGLVVPAAQPEALLAALTSLRAAPDLAAKLAAEGPRFAVAATSQAGCLGRAARFVDAIAGGPSASREAAA